MMNKFLSGALLLMALTACTPRTERVVILSTNDMHSHIENFPQLAEAVRRCRDTARQVILVDAGDRWTGNVYCDRAAEPRRPIIDLMNKLGYDVATFGNHEFDAGQAFLGERTAQCRFPVVCANILSDTASFPQPAPYVVIERAGLKLAFVGTVTNYDHNNHPAGHDESFVGLRFTDAVDAVAEHAGLRDSCNALIAVTHLGTARDRQLAAKAPAYDVIIGGHSHEKTNEMVNGVLVTQSGRNLQNVGVTVLEFRGGELVGKSFRIVPLADYEPVQAYQRMIEGYYSDPSLQEKVADIDGTINKRGLANLITASLREATKADVGVYHIGGVRLDSLHREAVVADIFNLDPFASRVVTVEMTSGQLERLVLAKFNDAVNIGESHHVDLYMTTPYVITTDASGDAVGVTFADLKPGRKYRVALGDYIFKNYDGLDCTGADETGMLVTDAIDAYLRAHAPFVPDNVVRQRVE